MGQCRTRDRAGTQLTRNSDYIYCLPSTTIGAIQPTYVNWNGGSVTFGIHDLVAL